MDKGKAERIVADSVDIRRVFAAANAGAAAVEAEAVSIHEAYVECQRGFEEILDIVDTGVSSDADRTTRVVLERAVKQPGVGTGDIVAVLSKWMGMSYNTSVEFVGAGVTIEDLSSSSEAFPADNVHDSVGLMSYYSQLPQLSRDFAEEGRAHWTDIRRAQQTQTMLWEAMRDSELNPEIAARIAERDAAIS